MLIGVPKEIKNHEYRVGLVPAAVREIVHHGHSVYIESQAGMGIGHSDAEYASAGASILPNAEEVFACAEMIVKVKEPQAGERKLLRPGQVLFTYLHLAPDYEQTADLVASGATCIAYETVTDAQGRLPLLAPMSEVAGRMSVQAGAMCLEKSRHGRGVLLGGVPGVGRSKVVILGGGVVGTNAAQMALGLGAQVIVIDRSLDALTRLDQLFRHQVETLYATRDAIESQVLQADLVIGGVLVPGDSAPRLVTEEMVASMRDGAAIVDVSIDQGGCIETSRPTTHSEPTYVEHGVVHYCVTNMPGAVAHTSAAALNNATLPFVLQIANKGAVAALTEDPHFMEGLNVAAGFVTNRSVSEIHGFEYLDGADALERAGVSNMPRRDPRSN